MTSFIFWKTRGQFVEQNLFNAVTVANSLRFSSLTLSHFSVEHVNKPYGKFYFFWKSRSWFVEQNLLNVVTVADSVRFSSLTLSHFSIQHVNAPSNKFYFLKISSYKSKGRFVNKSWLLTVALRCEPIEQHILDTNAGKQLSQTDTDV